MGSMKLSGLQGLRGYAILLVLLFHLWPNAFVNGFAGVDIFFVLSGHLMAMCYGSKIREFADFVCFYKKRFIRLFPAYFLVVLLTLIAGLTMLRLNEVVSLHNEVFWALLFGTNVRKLMGQANDYWSQIQNIYLLLHTWSLAVEVQYYLIFPVIYWLLARFSRVLFLKHAVAVASFVFSWAVDGPWSFDFLFSRFWQFHVGEVSYLVINKLSFNLNQHILPLSLLVLLIPTFCHSIVMEKTMRTFATVITGTFLLTTKADSATLLSHRVFTYLGDVSYVLYLLHWPIFVLFRYTMELESFDLTTAMLIGAATIVVSIGFHHYIERPLLETPVASAVLSALCWVISMATVVLIARQTRFYAMPEDAPKQFYWSEMTYVRPNLTTDQLTTNAIIRNRQFYTKTYIDPPGCEPYKPEISYGCRLTTTNGGKLRIAVMGNCFGKALLPAVYTILQNDLAELTLIGAYYWEPLDPRAEHFGRKFEDYNREILPLYDSLDPAPDVLFLIHRFHNNFNNPINGSLDNEALTQSALSHLLKLSQNVKVIVWGGVMHYFQEKWAEKVERTLEAGESIARMHEYPYQNYTTQKANCLKRVDYIANKCPKCVFLDLQKPFCNATSGRCKIVDRATHLSYYRDDNHWSWKGLELMMPFLRSSIAEIFAKFNVYDDKELER